MKYRLDNESFEECVYRIANALKDDDDHYYMFKDILMDMRFLPAGRVQAAMGSPRATTAYNCFVSGLIEDSMDSIMDAAKDAAETMRRGGGIGYDFSRLRPRGDLIKSLDSRASGPISFMAIFDAVCQTIASAGHRRGAQMGVLRIDHPDIEDFIRAKHNSDKLTGFNVSVGVTDHFMECLKTGKKFPLVWQGTVYRYIDPAPLWDQIMRSTWDWAEPGVLFIDRINEMNNLWYCEEIEATNPCGEQPLPPYGACLLGSFNMVKYIKFREGGKPVFDLEGFITDIPTVVRAMDNVIDRTVYPLPQQEREAKAKRRMGLGVTGMANALEVLGHSYGSPQYIEVQSLILATLRDECYRTSALLAKDKGAFPLFHGSYCSGEFILTLAEDVQELIRTHGIRNSHLTSIAPTGTISLTADNVSSGIEPPYLLYYDRTIQTFNGPIVERVSDYAYGKWGVEGKTANSITAQDHLRVLANAQQYVDSAVSKTCNVGDDVSFEEFKLLYENGWALGCKGLTTFRASGKRFGIFNAPEAEKEEAKAEACTFDVATGIRTCEI
jgi:ribonucleoside-diphosphate reductase alpha chain